MSLRFNSFHGYDRRFIIAVCEHPHTTNITNTAFSKDTIEITISTFTKSNAVFSKTITVGASKGVLNPINNFHQLHDTSFSRAAFH